MAQGLIYSPKGKAKEYIPDGYALNIYVGCSFGCRYCYAPKIMHQDKELYHIVGKPRKRFREKIIQEIILYKGKKVFLSFISDPFQPCEQEYKLTEFVLGEMLLRGVIPVILTKGIVSDKVFDLICSFKEVYFGCTLTSADNDVALTWEPKAPLASLRMDQIKRFHDRNVHTWVSLEPVIYPGEALEVIEKTHNYVDEYKIGKLNYENIGEKIDWKKFVDQVINLCEKYGVKYYIKNSLKEYLEI